MVPGTSTLPFALKVNAVRPPSGPVFPGIDKSAGVSSAVRKNSKSICLFPLVTTMEAPAYAQRVVNGLGSVLPSGVKGILGPAPLKCAYTSTISSF